MNYVRVATASLLLSAPVLGRAQTPAPIPIDLAKRYFAEARALCTADGDKLWGVSLCGPMMFVDAASREIVASEADAKGVLKGGDGVFVGVLPADQIVANTAVEWSGVRWTQILWPLPDDDRLRATLVAHELFHRIQPQLGLPTMNGGDNAHLDEVDGRYYMQLEWRALARALEAHSKAGLDQAASDALFFRAERYRIYPKAEAEERALEMNEGLAEYTGVRVGNPTQDLRTAMALHDLAVHVGDATFVRSFAYATGPAYGLLLDRLTPGWREKLKSGASLDAMLRSALHAGGSDGMTEREARYGGAALRASEVERDRKRQAVLALYRGEFIDGHKLTLRFRHMNVQFDPRNLQPLGDAGTVYPTIHISDDWGVLDAKHGALMKPDWSALVVSAPTSTSGSTTSGDGWTLALKPGWTIVPDSRSGDFVLSAPSSSH
ncbi:MAG TPA: hypothetical protein VIB98_09725 [Gemmatimonadaceae bacterium]